MKIGILIVRVTLASVLALPAASQELYKAPSKGSHTRWVSPENPTGQKGKGGQTNKGAKGNAFFTVKPGAQQILFDVKGAGIIRRMWMSGTIPRNEEQRRLVRIDMYWDNARKPAVSAPIGDFFGVGLGLVVPFENELFSNPEGRSFNFTIPMPFRTAAKIVVTNESSSHALIWYDIDYITLEQLPLDAMYFHAYWSRDTKTTLGRDFEILPTVEGVGRYLGTNIGVLSDSLCRGMWFGEGEVKVYLDGDSTSPTLVQTGTEDYIGSGWGQGEFHGRYSGSLVADKANDIYAFYRYHIPDPVYFHRDCRVTIQQIGSASTATLRRLMAKGAELKPVWVFDAHGEPDVLKIKGRAPDQIRLLDSANVPDIQSPFFPNGAVNYYRRDDVSATAYFYLNKPASSLPPLAEPELRVVHMREVVWSKVTKKY
ncbi:MAG: DUF2961 domain-containing protein [Ignavibacteriales bacterium]|nr:DUF2961 domain-containing protein [Ignavibacteriales bacterium]